MWELLPAAAVDKSKLPIFLTSWVDKSSSLCIYTMGQTRIWSLPHLKAGCWYINCRKIYYPVQEEDVRKAYETADSKGAPKVTDNAQEHEDEVEVDISVYSLRRRRIRLSNKEKGRPRRPRTRKKGKSRKVREQVSGRQWLPPIFHFS
jgi:hypothetical protein